MFKKYSQKYYFSVHYFVSLEVATAELKIFCVSMRLALYLCRVGI